VDKEGYSKMFSETLHMTFEELGDMFEGDFEDTCSEKFPLISIWGAKMGVRRVQTWELGPPWHEWKL
jgi:hypothetical protein